MKLKHFSKSVVGLVRKANEDSIGSLNDSQTNGNGDVFVVCDGMGGHVGGATASQLAIKSILEYFKGDVNSNPILALEKAISFANHQIFQLSQEDTSLKGMGTTCTLLLRKEDKIYIAHVGDSRIYLSSNNKLYRLTKDHSFVQKLVDVGQLEDSEMESHPRKNELTRALGIASDVEVEVANNPILAKSGDKFLLCTDGLCGLVNDPTILNTLNTTEGSNAVNELILLAENSGGNDNISVDLIQVVQSPHIKSVFKDQGNKTLTATQIIDIPTNNRDFLKRYQVYIFSALFILFSVVGYFIYSYSNKGVLIDEKTVYPEKIETDKNLTNSNIESNPVLNDSIEYESENEEIKVTNQFEREAIQKKKIKKLEKEKLEKSENRKKIKETNDYINKIELKISNKNPKYNRSFDMKLLRNELNRLISFVKEKKYEKIDNQIKKVDDKFIDLEIYIQEKELSNAKKEANKILKGLKNTSYKENLKQEISNLKLSLQKNNIIYIRQKIDLLRKKEVALKKDLIKQNDSINTIKSNDEEPQKNE